MKISFPLRLIREKFFCFLSVIFNSAMKPDKLGKLAQKAAVILKPKLDTLVYYGKVELIPPKPTEIGEIAKSVGRILNNFRTGAWKELTVKQALLNTLVGLEVGCWFFVGECLAKGSIIGYRLQ